MNGYRMIDDMLFQVKAVGPASATATIASAAERIDVLLGGPSSLPASGPVSRLINRRRSHLACYRQTPLEVDELVNGELWTNMGGIYRLQIEQTS